MRVSVFVGIILVAVGVMALVPGFGGGIGFSFGTENVRIEKKADAGSVDSIQIDAGPTDVTLVPRSGNEIVVTLSGKTGSRHRDKWELQVERQGSALSIAPTVPKVMFAPFSFLREELTVELPEKMWERLEVRTGSGDVRAESVGAAGEINIRTGSGDIDAERLDGAVIRMKLGSGDVKLETVKANDLELETGSGDIKATGYDAGTLTFKASSGDVTLEGESAALSGTTGSGDIRIEQEELSGDTALRAGSGDVTLLLDDEPKSLAFEFKTGSGDSRVDWPSIDEGGRSDDGDRTGTFGDGELKLDIRTGSGDIKFGER